MIVFDYNVRISLMNSLTERSSSLEREMDAKLGPVLGTQEQHGVLIAQIKKLNGRDQVAIEIFLIS